MFKQVVSVAAATVFLGTIQASAAPIDLDALLFEEASPSYSGSGDIVYDDFTGFVMTDFFNPLALDDFPGSDINLSYDLNGGGGDFADVFYDPDLESFDIVAFGFTDNSLEFLLSRSAFSDEPAVGVGPDAILRVTSDLFDFSADDPLSYFSANADPFDGLFLASTDLTLTSLTAVPLPASLPLALAGLGALGFLARRKRT